MPGLKRTRESADAAASSKPRTKDESKRPRKDAAAASSSKVAAVLPPAVEADFPRGGGSGLTPLEHAQALREGRAERASAAAGKDLFTDGAARKKGKGAAAGASGGDDVAAQKEKKRKDWREMKNAKKKKTAMGVERAGQGELDHTRVEHLNYKVSRAAVPPCWTFTHSFPQRLAPGSRLLCSVLAVHPLALVLSLPNQLLGHVPLTSISSVLTERLDAAANASDSESEAESSDDEDEEMKTAGDVPELRDLYKVGDWVRASVVSVKNAGNKGLGREGQEYVREAGRVELSLDPALLNEGIESADLIPGAVLPVTVKSREDHGWTLDAGIGISGFAPLDAAPSDVQVGAVLPAAVTAHVSGSRAFTASLQPAAVLSARLGPTHAPTLNGLLPGTYVTALITNASASGLSAKLWGFFDASIDPTHLPLPHGKTAADVYKEGQKVKARVLWDLGPHAAGADPLEVTAEKQGGRKLALSAAPHALKLSPPPGLSHYPIGTKLSVRVVRADKDWGLACEIEDADDEVSPQVFCHISHVADEHIVALSASSGTWKEGSVHPARVTGHAPTDGRVLVSLQPSVLKRAFMRVSEVQVGSIVRGTVARLGPNGNAIFLDLGGSVHGVVFPLHFADVPLRKPEKKYKVGATVKARVLAVDPLKNRISCTLKKSLVGSDLPIVAALQDARPGVVTQGTVSRFIEPTPGKPNALLVDLFGGLRALVPAVEATEAAPGAQPLQLRSAYFEGKVVRVRLTHVDYASARITASIRQAAPSYLARLDVDAVTLGQKVDARTAAVHADVVVLELLPSRARALLSLAALAEERGKSVEEVRAELEEGEVLTGLTVIDKNKDKGLVILGNSSAQPRSNKAAELQPGHLAAGKVIESGREPNAVTVLLPGGVRARLHATDCADEFSEEPLPPVEKDKDSKPLDVVVLSIRGTTKKRAVVSTRPSVLAAARGETAAAPRDAVVESAADLQPKEKRRGYVKAIADSGLFVDLGRGVTARVMIAELFDSYVKDWKPRFRVGQLVEGTVMR
jgi:rRNA biogenesis protein RRP5